MKIHEGKGLKAFADLLISLFQGSEEETIHDHRTVCQILEQRATRSTSQ